jgi:DNA repair protein RadC
MKVNELQIQYKKCLTFGDDKVHNSNIAYKLFMKFWDSTIDYKESFNVMYLDNAQQIIALHRHSIGTTGMVVVNIKEIVGAAILCNATGVIVAHNHPSGCTTPSMSDDLLTKRLKEALELFDITLIDHLIVTLKGFNSILV